MHLLGLSEGYAFIWSVIGMCIYLVYLPEGCALLGLSLGCAFIMSVCQRGVLLLGLSEGCPLIVDIFEGSRFVSVRRSIFILIAIKCYS